MSTKAQVDVPRLIREILSAVCPECREKVLAVEIPMSQIMTVRDLTAQTSA